jgi:hypothetical protein
MGEEGHFISDLLVGELFIGEGREWEGMGALADCAVEHWELMVEGGEFRRAQSSWVQPNDQRGSLKLKPHNLMPCPETCHQEHH